MSERPELERKKYEGIYSSTDGKYKGYGHSNHGGGAARILAAQKPSAIVDVGCGWNEFCKEIKKLSPDTRTVGVDFACPGADVIADATNLPFGDKEFDTLTAFDMLEHVLPGQVKAVLAEFARVSKKFIFSISHQPSVITWENQNLHPCVHSENWWITEIMHAGGCSIKKTGRYIMGNWDTKPSIDPKAKIILVGNGPSVLKGYGSIIDSFDEVIRFNAYAFEQVDAKTNEVIDLRPHTGTKTTIWSTFGKGTLPGTEQRPDRVIYIHGEVGKYSYDGKETYKIPRWFYDNMRKTVSHINEYVLGLKGDGWRPFPERDLIASSGLIVLSWLLQVVQVERVTLIGFDNFNRKLSSQHHYYTPGRFGRTREHSGEVESILCGLLEEEGRVTYL